MEACGGFDGGREGEMVRKGAGSGHGDVGVKSGVEAVGAGVRAKGFDP